MWYTATITSVTNGAAVVAMTTGDDISIIQEDSGLIFECESPVQVKRGYIDGSGNLEIKEWYLEKGRPLTDSAIALNTDYLSLETGIQLTEKPLLNYLFLARSGLRHQR